jgi:hypothetical protein
MSSSLQVLCFRYEANSAACVKIVLRTLCHTGVVVVFTPQNPDHQVVMPTVAADVAFGLGRWVCTQHVATARCHPEPCYMRQDSMILLNAIPYAQV